MTASAGNETSAIKTLNLPKNSEGGDDTTFSVDQKVEARYAGGPKFYPGTITELQTNGKEEMVTCSIHYDDGEDEGSSCHFLLSFLLVDRASS
jgi:hypothetical protein